MCDAKLKAYKVISILTIEFLGKFVKISKYVLFNRMKTVGIVKQYRKLGRATDFIAYYWNKNDNEKLGNRIS